MPNYRIRSGPVFVVTEWAHCCHTYAVSLYTVSQKVYPLMFDNNFGKTWTEFKILSPIDSQEKSSMYTSQRFPPQLQYIATLPCDIRKSKNVTDFSRRTKQLIC